jgi:hypothetical protein
VTLVLATVFGVGGVAADCRAETEETAERVVQDEPLPELPIAATAENRQPTGTVSDRIPNVMLKGICPGMTTNILKVREQMAEKGFTDFTFVSISLEPEVDNPEQLRNYMKAYEIENKPGLPKWIFLTGKIEDVDAIRRALGAYDLDEEVDADITQHGGMITYGNDRTGWWNAVAALMEPKLITPAIMRLTNDALPPLPSRAGVVKESIIPELSRRGLLVE